MFSLVGEEAVLYSSPFVSGGKLVKSSDHYSTQLFLMDAEAIVF